MIQKSSSCKQPLISADIYDQICCLLCRTPASTCSLESVLGLSCRRYSTGTSAHTLLWIHHFSRPCVLSIQTAYTQLRLPEQRLHLFTEAFKEGCRGEGCWGLCCTLCTDPINSSLWAELAMQAPTPKHRMQCHPTGAGGCSPSGWVCCQPTAGHGVSGIFCVLLSLKSQIVSFYPENWRHLKLKWQRSHYL